NCIICSLSNNNSYFICNDSSTTEIYTLSLHDALPICLVESKKKRGMVFSRPDLLRGIKRLLDPQILGRDTLQDIFELRLVLEMGDRKSTRLNSSHVSISYAVFCLKKKKKIK